MYAHVKKANPYHRLNVGLYRILSYAEASCYPCTIRYCDGSVYCNVDSYENWGITCATLSHSMCSTFSVVGMIWHNVYIRPVHRILKNSEVLNTPIHASSILLYAPRITASIINPFTLICFNK